MNGSYHATSEHPEMLVYTYGGEESIMGLYEASWDSLSGKVYPRQHLKALTDALPLLKNRFSSNLKFSEATLEQLLETIREKPAALRRLPDIDDFLNRGDHFEARPLPDQAQWAPVFGISVADFDGDGIEDLFLAQNFFAMQPEVPRLDAGRACFFSAGGRKFQGCAGPEFGN